VKKGKSPRGAIDQLHDYFFYNSTTTAPPYFKVALAKSARCPHGGSKCIEKVAEKRYKIAEHGKTILKRNPSSLTIKDL
jgi:hypothetical protein